MYKISIAIAGLSVAGLVQAGDLTVHIQNISAAQAPVICALYDKQKGFPLKREWSVATTIADGKASCVFKNVTAPRVAISVVEDWNNNGKVDTSFVGAPEEPWGVSNNAQAHRFGPPDFADAAIDMTDISSIDIVLIAP